MKISNGEVTIKDVYTRKTQKEYNKALSEGMKMKADQGGNANIEGFTMEALDKANDVLLLNMVEKIEINGEEKPVKQETFDEMNSADVDKIIGEITKLMQGPEKKS